MTFDEAMNYNQRQLDQGEITGEHLSALTLLWQETYSLTEDGCCGPTTRGSILSVSSAVDEGGTLGEAALSIAKTQLGFGEEGGNNQGPHVAQYRGRPDTPEDAGSWCAAFMSWCFDQAADRLGRDLPFERSEGAKKLFANAKRAGTEHRDPQPGDLVCWHRGDPTSWTGHIGIVESVGDGGVFHTIEGNVGRFPAKVRRFIHEADDERLIGFARLE